MVPVLPDHTFYTFIEPTCAHALALLGMLLLPIPCRCRDFGSHLSIFKRLSIPKRLVLAVRWLLVAMILCSVTLAVHDTPWKVDDGC
jgi:hypothetical protein